MISKPVPASSFYHTCRYICNKPGAEIILTEGVRGYSYKVMADDFMMQQQMRLSKSLACFHSILSFYPGENPSDEIIKEIASKYLERLNITNTQYAVAKHTDKAHLHLHIIANMVDNNGKAISDSWIGLRGKKIAQQLTREYNLVPALEKKMELTHLQALSGLDANKYKIYMAIFQSLPHCRTMEELENQLLKQGIKTQYKYKGQTDEKQGISFKVENICLKGSQVDRKFSLAALEKTLELQRGQLREQEHKQEQKPAQENRYGKLNPTNKGIQSSYQSPEGGNEPGNYLAKSLENTVELLMKPEDTNEQMSDDISKEAERRRKKKQSKKRSKGLHH